METGSELRMIADGSGFTTIEEFRSGAMTATRPTCCPPSTWAKARCWSMSARSPAAARASEVLVDTDQVVGMFDDVEFIGLGANQDATLTVDYETDKVTVTLGAAGQGTGRSTWPPWATCSTPPMMPRSGMR
jgi:hypothetical protein